MLDFKKDLFEIFQKNDGDFQKYEKVIDYCTKIEHVTEGEAKAECYEILRQLENLINNAGWEEKKDIILRILWDERYAICENYEEFLP